MTIRTHYDNLHVAPDADAQTIRQAYRRLSKQYHPDLNTDPDAHRIMQLINQAYEVLSDPQKRAEHDQWIAQQRAAERLKAQVQAMQQQYAAAQKQPAQYPPVPTAPAAAPPVPPHKTGLVILFSGLCLLLMVGLGLLIWDRQDNPETAKRTTVPAASAPAETPVFGHMGQPAAGTANATHSPTAPPILTAIRNTSGRVTTAFLSKTSATHPTYSPSCSPKTAPNRCAASSFLSADNSNCRN